MKRIDIRALALAVAIEAVLAVLAVYGGPHGALGGIPWLLQMPGMFVMIVGPSDASFAWRAAGVIAVQIVCWYVVLAFLWRRADRRRTPTA